MFVHVYILKVPPTFYRSLSSVVFPEHSVGLSPLALNFPVSDLLWAGSPAGQHLLGDQRGSSSLSPKEIIRASAHTHCNMYSGFLSILCFAVSFLTVLVEVAR